MRHAIGHDMLHQRRFHVGVAYGHSSAYETSGQKVSILAAIGIGPGVAVIAPLDKADGRTTGNSCVLQIRGGCPDIIHGCIKSCCVLSEMLRSEARGGGAMRAPQATSRSRLRGRSIETRMFGRVLAVQDGRRARNEGRFRQRRRPCPRAKLRNKPQLASLLRGEGSWFPAWSHSHRQGAATGARSIRFCLRPRPRASAMDGNLPHKDRVRCFWGYMTRKSSPTPRRRVFGQDAGFCKVVALNQVHIH